MFQQTARIIRNQPTWLRRLEALLLLTVVVWLDLLTSYEITLSVFYAIPILWSVWLFERRLVWLVVFLAWAAWAALDMLSGHPYSSVASQFCQFFTRGGYFIAVAAAGRFFKEQQVVLAAQIELLKHSRLLEHQIVKVSEYEQQRIGQDLHDGLCQYFAAIACSASTLQSDLGRRGLPEFAAAAGEISALLTAGVVETRNLSRGLMPVQMGEGGLPSALQELADSASQLLGIRCTCDAAVGSSELEGATAIHLFRITQEAINNATKHGQARSVEIRLSANRHVTNLSVADDGHGISGTTPSSNGMGLSIMRYRAGILGGELIIENREPQGTVVSCTAPLRELAA